MKLCYPVQTIDAITLCRFPRLAVAIGAVDCHELVIELRNDLRHFRRQIFYFFRVQTHKDSLGEWQRHVVSIKDITYQQCGRVRHPRLLSTRKFVQFQGSVLWNP